MWRKIRRRHLMHLIFMFNILQTVASNLDAYYRELQQYYQGETQRVLRHTKRCQYSLVINQIDAQQCPQLADSLIDDGRRGKRDFHRESDSTVSDLKLSLKKSEENMHFCQANITENQVRLEHLEQVVTKLVNATNLGHHDKLGKLNDKLQKYHRMVKSLEHKLLSVMTNMGEMQLMMDKRLPKIGSIHEKEIEVVSVGEMQTCKLNPNIPYYRDCLQIYWRGHRNSGVYYVKPLYASCPIPVWCDMDTPGGGWLVISRRLNDKCNYNRGWGEYRKGFCNVTGDHWLGNDNMFLLSHQAKFQLRVDLWDFKGSRVYAEYNEFWIGGEKDNYRLHVGNYSGTAGEGLTKHDGQEFSTPDIDNDSYDNYHCAQSWLAGWWFNNCWFSFLNGQYYNKTDVEYRTISWNDWKAEQLFKTEMKIRPIY